MVSAFFKEDPLVKELKQAHLLTNSLTHSFLPQSLKTYQSWVDRGEEEGLIKQLLKVLEEKGHVMKKLKIMSLWIEMFKETKYDLSDIIMNKKLKIFTKNAILKEPIGSSTCISYEDQQNYTDNHILHHINPQNLEDFLLSKVLIPLYNYFMKLALNEELFKLCIIGKVPEDDVFRRGSKIKFIWIFKLYNLINPLVPIVCNCAAILQKFP